MQNGERNIELSNEEFREIAHAVEQERCRSEVKNRLVDMVQFGGHAEGLLEDAPLIEDILEAYLDNLRAVQKTFAEECCAALDNALDLNSLEIRKYEAE